MFGLTKILKMCKTSYFPAGIFAAVLFWHFAQTEYNAENYIFWHMAFYILFALNLIFISVVKQTKPAFLLLWTAAVYITVNNIKHQYGVEGLHLPVCHTLLILLPLNWIFFTIRDETGFYDIRNFYALCAVLLQFFAAENAGAFLPQSAQQWLPEFILGEWIAAGIFLLFYTSTANNIKLTSTFYAFLCLGTAVANADSVSSSLFFCSAVFLLCSGTVHNFVYTYFRDDLTGINSRKTYERHALKTFPLKYSLGVICIDDYAKLLKVFGTRRINHLIKMVIKKINDQETGALLYRYNADEFILIFKNEDKKQSYEYLENIRRSIAGAEFVLDRKTTVKITVSAGVSEKKRSDADAFAVLERTREVLQKAYKFTQNITSKA